MDETKIEKRARLSGRVASKVIGALERRGYDIRGEILAPISRVPRRAPLDSLRKFHSDYSSRHGSTGLRFVTDILVHGRDAEIRSRDHDPSPPKG
jgi:hypothetical protein